MQSHRYTPFLIVTLVLISLMSAPTVLYTRTQDNRNVSIPQSTESDAIKKRLPIADYFAPESADVGLRAKRHIRGKKYDKSSWTVDPEDPSTDTVRVDYVDPNLPALPFGRSDVVVVAVICEAQAYLSNDKTGIYSEFTILIKEIIKNNSSTPLSPDALIQIEREGGRVNFAPGRLHTYHIAGEGVPAVGSEYVLFLKDNRLGQDVQYHIVTGYELNAGKVVPLDSGAQFNTYKGRDEATFLSELQRAAVIIGQPKTN